jgi:hypothetical protein
VSDRTQEDTRKAEVFKAAVAWVASQHGPDATVEAFGDAEANRERERLEAPLVRSVWQRSA